MEATLISWCYEVDEFSGASRLCCSTIQSAVNLQFRDFMSTLREACREKFMSIRGDNDPNANSIMAVVHEQLPRLRGSVNVVRVSTQLSSIKHPLE